jgi:hypothetical protein
MVAHRTWKSFGLVVAVIGVGAGSIGCDKVMKAAKDSQKHAAIAFDEKTGGWGYSHDHLTPDLAKKAATEKCSSCTVRVTWNQGCGALAQSESKKEVMTTGLGSNQPAAESAARKECAAAGGGDKCKILVWACNSK